MPFPSQSDEDLVIGLSTHAPTAYTDLATIVRFNTTGTIDVRNGANYAAQTTVAYSTGISYHVVMSVNVSAHTYSVTVKPAGGSIQTLATNYAFRSEQATATSLNYLSKYGDPGRCECLQYRHYD